MSTVVTLIARDMYSPFTLDVIRGAVEAAMSGGARLTVAPYPEPRPGKRWADELAAGGTAGLIAVTSRLDHDQRVALAERGIHLVVIDPVSEPEPDVVSIGATNWAGTYNATQHLLELGHRQIAILGGLADTMSSRARVSGFEAAMRGVGAPLRPEYHSDRDFTFDSGVELGGEILGLQDPPTAVIAASDFQALGVIEAARRAGLRVPEDLSIVGFDDLIVAQMSSPPLTTVRQPVSQMGALATQNVLALITGGAGSVPARSELATQLIVRGTTAPPRKLV